MEWYIRFKKGDNLNKWMKARNYQIKNVENYINHGIQSNTDIKLTFIDYIKKDCIETNSQRNYQLLL